MLNPVAYEDGILPCAYCVSAERASKHMQRIGGLQRFRIWSALLCYGQHHANNNKGTARMLCQSTRACRHADEMRCTYVELVPSSAGDPKYLHALLCQPTLLPSLQVSQIGWSRVAQQRSSLQGSILHRYMSDQLFSNSCACQYQTKLLSFQLMCYNYGQSLTSFLERIRKDAAPCKPVRVEIHLLSLLGCAHRREHQHLGTFRREIAFRQNATPAMVLPMATGIMFRQMYWPTETGAPFFMPKGTCRRREGSELWKHPGAE